MEDLERKFEHRFARMEARMEAENAKMYGLLMGLMGLIQKSNPEMEKGNPEMEKYIGGIRLNTLESEKPSNVGIEGNLNGGDEIASLHAALIKAKQEIAAKEKELKELKNLDLKRKKTISELLISTSKAEREERRLKVRQDSLRLGSVVLVSAGTEGWKDGPVFSDLKAEHKKLQQEREDIESLLLNIRVSDNVDGLTEELYECRRNKIVQEQAAILEQRARFELEKGRMIREMKRIHDEDGSQFKDFKIHQDRYIFLNLLGKGGYSEVYKAFDLVEHRYVACKLHCVNEQWNAEKKENYIRHTNRECRIHKTLDHGHIVHLWETFEIDDKTVCAVQEYCTGKDLDDVLKATPILPEREARIILVQIFHALIYLNKRTPKIIHYDLKPGNVLFDELGVAKLTDFGLSKIVESDVGSQGMELTSPGAGTYWYLPPECFDFNNNPLISCKVDVWSAGILFYQMLFGKRPFGHDQTQASILHEGTIINAHMVEFPSRSTVSDGAKEFIRRCLTYDQAERPSILTIAEDPYLTTLSPDQESQ